MIGDLHPVAFGVLILGLIIVFFLIYKTFMYPISSNELFQNIKIKNKISKGNTNNLSDSSICSYYYYYYYCYYYYLFYNIRFRFIIISLLL